MLFRLYLFLFFLYRIYFTLIFWVLQILESCCLFVLLFLHVNFWIGDFTVLLKSTDTLISENVISCLRKPIFIQIDCLFILEIVLDLWRSDFVDLILFFLVLLNYIFIQINKGVVFVYCWNSILCYVALVAEHRSVTMQAFSSLFWTCKLRKLLV